MGLDERQEMEEWVAVEGEASVGRSGGGIMEAISACPSTPACWCHL